MQSINIFYVDETDITNYSIQLLTKHSFIKKLRLKGCSEIDDEAIPHINNIKGLELLQTDGTSISINGVLQLSVSHPLRRLLIGVDKPEQHLKDLTRIAQRFPDCELLVNPKSFTIKKDDDWSI